MKIHEIKILAQYAERISAGVKPWEMRKNDRDYQTGDFIDMTILQDGKHPTEEHLYGKITYTFHGPKYALPEDWVIMTIDYMPEQQWRSLVFGSEEQLVDPAYLSQNNACILCGTQRTMINELGCGNKEGTCPHKQEQP